MYRVIKAAFDDEIIEDDMLEDEADIQEGGSFNTAVENVMIAYQNGNKWLDSVKEDLLINKNMPHFSQYIHDLAHTMPVRFDVFSDIIHTQNIWVPYPATEYIPYDIEDMDGIFEAIFGVLEGITESLNAFIKETEGTSKHSMACSAEELLMDIDAEYENILRIEKAQEDYRGDNSQYDKWIHSYLDQDVEE